MSGEEREEVLKKIRGVLDQLPEALLWDIRRMALAASSQDNIVPVLPFDRAVSEGLRLLPKDDLVAIMGELQQSEPAITRRVLAPLKREYNSDRLTDYVKEDLAKATVQVWEILQIKSRSTRLWLARRDFERVRWRLGLLSVTLHEKLLARMVHISCDRKYIVEAIMDAADRRIAATRLAYKLSDHIKLTSRDPPDDSLLCTNMPYHWDLLRRLKVVLRLLQLLERTNGEGGAEGQEQRSPEAIPISPSATFRSSNRLRHSLTEVGSISPTAPLRSALTLPDLSPTFDRASSHCASRTESRNSSFRTSFSVDNTGVPAN